MINIKNLRVKVLWEDKEILKWISLDFELWKNYCLLWKNWSGKSTLCSFLMGYPKYEYVSGTVTIDNNIKSGHPQGVHPTDNNVGAPLVGAPNTMGAPNTICAPNTMGAKNLLDLSTNDRSKAWLFLSFQNIPEIKWIKLSEYLRTIYNISLQNNNPEIRKLSPFIFKKFIWKYLSELKIDEIFLDRELNVWFSWWEKRKIEILQMKLIWPKYIILDEIDSGLDLDAFRTIAEMLRELSSEKNSLIIITHYFKILEYIDVDKVFIMKDWKIVKQGSNELIEEVKEKGFEDF